MYEFAVADDLVQVKSRAIKVVPTRRTVKRERAYETYSDLRMLMGGSRLWLSSYFEDKPLVQHVKKLNGARKAAVATNSKFLTTLVRTLSSFVPLFFWSNRRRI